MPKFSDVAHTSVTAPDVKAPLEDKVAYIHYLMRMRAIGQEVVRHNGVVGRQVRLALKPLIRDAFPMPDAQLENLSSDIRQVLRKIGAAVCISHGAHEVPVWFVADEISNEYIAVARWVANGGAKRHHEATELTPREKRLTPQEAGEDRDPAPVEVRQAPAPEATTTKDGNLMPQSAEFLSKIAKDYQAEQRETFIGLVKQAFKELDSNVLSGYEIAEYLAPVTGSMVTSLRGRIRELANDGVLYTRRETEDERSARFGTARGGSPASLYALKSAHLKERHVAKHKNLYPNTSESKVKPNVPTPTPEPTVDLTAGVSVESIAIMVKGLVDAEVSRRLADYDAMKIELAELRAFKRRIDRATRG